MIYFGNGNSFSRSSYKYAIPYIYEPKPSNAFITEESQAINTTLLTVDTSR